MAERNYYCFCDAGCKFETMTKEQIIAAIMQAVNEGTISNIDEGFISKVKEQNKGNTLYFWVGTTAEYNALENRLENCFYIKTDDTQIQEIAEKITTIFNALEFLYKENKTRIKADENILTVVLENKAAIEEFQNNSGAAGEELFKGVMPYKFSPSQTYTVNNLDKYKIVLVKLNSGCVTCTVSSYRIDGSDRKRILGSFDYYNNTNFNKYAIDITVDENGAVTDNNSVEYISNSLSTTNTVSEIIGIL